MTEAGDNTRGRRLAAAILRATGLGLSLALGVIASLKLPCLSGGCDAVLASQWAKPLGVPLGFYGAVFWLATLIGPTLFRVAAHHVLALGSIGLMALQVLAIGRVCPWCLAHAGVCLLAWPWRAMTVSRAWFGAGLVVAAAIAGLHVAARSVPEKVPGAAALVASGFDWLGVGPAGADSALVVDLSCPVCLDELQGVADDPGRHAWRVIFRSSGRSANLARRFVASVLGHPAGARESFPAMLQVLLTQRELVLAQPEQAAVWWKTLFVADEKWLRIAGELLDRQNELLAAAGVVASPVLVSADGNLQVLANGNDLPGGPAGEAQGGTR